MLSKIFLCYALAMALPAAQSEWSVVTALPAGVKVEIHRENVSPLRGKLVRATESEVVVQAKKSDQSIPRADVKRVKVPSTTLRLLYGAIGVGVGITVGALICHSCLGEGDGVLLGQMMALGAGAGALAFLIPGYKTIYKAPKKP
jgi:hypothetical protein